MSYSRHGTHFDAVLPLALSGSSVWRCDRSGDLQGALDGSVGAMPSRETIAGSEAALDLIRTWTSAPMAVLRKKLGLAK